MGIKRLQFSDDKKKAQREFIAYVMRDLSSSVKFGQNPEEILEFFQGVRLLSPMRKGPFGSEILNHLIWQEVSRNTPASGWMAIPIMIIANDYHQELFNGETGVLIRRLPLQSIGSEGYALFFQASRRSDASFFCIVIAQI